MSFTSPEEKDKYNFPILKGVEVKELSSICTQFIFNKTDPEIVEKVCELVVSIITSDETSIMSEIKKGVSEYAARLTSELEESSYDQKILTVDSMEPKFGNWLQKNKWISNTTQIDIKYENPNESGLIQDLILWRIGNECKLAVHFASPAAKDQYNFGTLLGKVEATGLSYPSSIIFASYGDNDYYLQINSKIFKLVKQVASFEKELSKDFYVDFKIKPFLQTLKLCQESKEIALNILDKNTSFDNWSYDNTRTLSYENFWLMCYNNENKHSIVERLAYRSDNLSFEVELIFNKEILEEIRNGIDFSIIDDKNKSRSIIFEFAKYDSKIMDKVSEFSNFLKNIVPLEMISRILYKFSDTDKELTPLYCSLLLELSSKNFKEVLIHAQTAKVDLFQKVFFKLGQMLEESGELDKAAEIFKVFENSNQKFIYEAWESANNSFVLGKYEEALEHVLKICYMPEALILISASINAATLGYMDDVYGIDNSSITTIIDTLNKKAPSLKLEKVNVLVKLIQENISSEVLVNAFATLFTKDQLSVCKDYVKKYGGSDSDIAVKLIGLQSSDKNVNADSIKFEQILPVIKELIQKINALKVTDYKIAEALIQHDIPNEILYDIINQLTLTQEEISKLLGEKGILFVSNKESSAVVNSEGLFKALSEKAGTTVYPDGTMISLDGSIYTLGAIEETLELQP